MGWSTIYITGKSDFREEVLRKLDHSSLDFMPGYAGASYGSETHELYWLNETITLREFKEAIGSKLIWKYRLNFYPSLEAFIESQNASVKKKTEFTEEDRALLEEITASVYREAS